MKKLIVICVCAFGVLFSILLGKLGEKRGLEEKHQMLLAIACQHPDLEIQLANLDIPKHWALAKVIDGRPELYSQIVKNIVAECSDVQL